MQYAVTTRVKAEFEAAAMAKKEAEANEIASAKALPAEQRKAAALRKLEQDAAVKAALAVARMANKVALTVL